MPTNLELARPISAEVEIGSINLRDASVRSRIDPVSGAPDEVFLDQSFRAWGELAGEDRIVVSVELNFAASEGAPSLNQHDADTLVSLSATYSLTYRRKETSAIDPMALQAFAELNGPYNAWPYWRELVHTVSGRVGLASIVIPVFRLPVRQMPSEDQNEPPPRPKRRRKQQ